MIELTVKRPNGEIEKVLNDKFFSLHPDLFAKMKEATRNAGRGEILSWKDVDGRTDAEKAAHALNDKIAKCEIELARARDNDPQAACILRDGLEALKEQRRNLK
jgi:hypothetical protein